MTIERRRGRPRSTIWVGKLGAFANDFTVTRLAGELEVDTSTIYRWARGAEQPAIRTAIVLVEIAQAAGRKLTLDDIYESRARQVRAKFARLHAD